MHDGDCLREQGVFYLPASHGKGGGIHASLHDQRDCVRRRICAAAPCFLRAGRRIVFHAAFGCPYISDRGLSDMDNVQGVNGVMN